MKTLLVIACAICLAACVATVPKASLRPASGAPLHLAASFTVIPESGPTAGVSLTLMPGEYVPVLANSQGIFFRGPKNGIVQRQEGERRTLLRQGGIWFATVNPGFGPRIYVYDGLATVVPDSPSGPKPGNSATAGTTFPLPVPPHASPSTVGIGAALGFVIVAAMAQIDETDVLFITDSLPEHLHLETRFLKNSPQEGAAAPEAPAPSAGGER